MKRAVRGFLCWVFVWTVLLPAPSAAEPLALIGGTSFVYDEGLGDGIDRWRSGGAQASVFLRGPRADWEFRARTDTIVPSRGTADRLAAAYMGIGGFRYARMGSFDSRLGVEVIGVDADLFDLQDELGSVLPGSAYDGEDTIEDAIHPTIQAEISTDMGLPFGTLRPFAEAEAGFENFVRAGADLMFGQHGFADRMTRHPVTGFLMPPQSLGASDETLAVRLYLGADVSRDYGSELFDGGDVTARDYRSRVRAGAMMQGKDVNLFYGLTRLGREFDGQEEPQWLGAISVSFRF